MDSVSQSWLSVSLLKFASFVQLAMCSDYSTPGSASPILSSVPVSSKSIVER